jgi:hypothetical protein
MRWWFLNIYKYQMQSFCVTLGNFSLNLKILSVTLWKDTTAAIVTLRMQTGSPCDPENNTGKIVSSREAKTETRKEKLAEILKRFPEH